jgi:nitroreductase
MELLKAIKERRAIRKYKPDQVADEKVEIILESARWAPYANLHPWQFIVVKDPKALRNLWKITPGAFGKAPLAIVVCIDQTKVFFPSIADASFATQNMLLAAYDLDLGSCPMVSFPRIAVKELLAIPNGLEPEIIVAIGRADEEPSAPSRPPLSEITFLNEYGNKYRR